MIRSSVQPRDRIFVKGYGFPSFAKNMGRNTGKNISKNYFIFIIFLFFRANNIQKINKK